MFKDSFIGSTFFDPEAERKARENEKNWREAFRQEFGIHFDCESEKNFCIEFIEEVEQEAYQRGFEEGIKERKMTMAEGRLENNLMTEL